MSTDALIPKQSFFRPLGTRENIMVRRRYVFEQKRRGHNIDDITETWNAKCDEEGFPDEKVTRATVAKDVQFVLKTMAEDIKIDVVEYRQLLIARIEHAISTEKFQKKIESGDVQYIDRLLKATAQIAQMTGANAPTKVAQTDTEGRDVMQLTDEERRERVRQFLELAQQRAAEQGVIVDVTPENP